MEDRNSIYLRKLNSEIIDLNVLIESRKLKNKIKTIQHLVSYICNGNFKHIRNQFKNKIKSNNNVETDFEKENFDIGNSRVAIYTVLFGNYDFLKDPMYISENCDYYVLTNQEIKSEIWKKIDIKKYENATKGMSNLELARFYKTHPHILFDKYEYSIFIDANVQIVADLVPMISTLNSNFISIHRQPGRDCIYDEAEAIISLKKAKKEEVKHQIDSYKNNGFPHHFGLFQTNVLVRRHNDSECIKIMDCWWEEMVKYTKRDQLSFTYTLWSLGYTKESVSLLGNNTALNPRVRVRKHI